MFEKNRITQLLGIELPVIQGGMVWCSGWRLASAVSECGGLGVIGAGSMTAVLLEEHLNKMAAATKKPYGVNLPLLYSDVEGCVAHCIEHHVPVVITSAGSPAKYTGRLHEAGIVVGHVVPSPKFARKAAAAGVDFIVAEGMEAGGHNGLEEISASVLLQTVAAETEIPLVSAGGYMDGRGLVAALALGADGIQIGSRFACTVESSASEAFKKHLLNVKDLGTVLTSRSWGPTRIVPNTFGKELLELESKGASMEAQLAFIGTGRSRRGIFEGDLEQGELEIGQIAAAFTTIPTVKEVMDNIVTTYHDTIARLTKV